MSVTVQTPGTTVNPARSPSSPRPFALVRHSAALAKRSLIKLTRTPEAFIDVTLQPIIFLLLFVYVFGGAIAGNTSDYLQYLLPGILAQTVAMTITIGVNLNSDIEKGVFDRFRSLPIARSAPLLGAVFADVVRYLTICVGTLGFGYVMGFRIQTNALAAASGCLIAIAFAVCLSWVSVFIGMKARSSGAVQGLTFLVILPLSFGSTVFVQADTLPTWMQGFVSANPLTHLVDTVRGLFLGGPVAGPLAWTVAWMVGLVVVFVPLALRAYNRKA
jgi:oleandomycin transport system permease protein